MGTVMLGGPKDERKQHWGLSWGERIMGIKGRSFQIKKKNQNNLKIKWLQKMAVCSIFWASEVGEPALAHSCLCLIFFLVNLWWLFFFSSYSVPKFFAFLFSCHSLHSLITFTFLLAYRASAFIISFYLFSSHPYSPVLFLLPTEGVENLLFLQDHGWPTFLPQALSWQSSRREKSETKQFLMQMNKELPGNQFPSPFLSLTDFSKKISRSPLFLVSKGESAWPCTCTCIRNTI